MGLYRAIPNNERSYLFIDGAYLTARMDAFCTEYYGHPVKIDYRSIGAGHNKIFYYDSLPVQRKGESDEDFSARLLTKKQLFAYLRSLDGWHVHEGISKRSQGQAARQKEVDILIAVDMLGHTHRRNMEKLTFIAGDQDFRPLVDAVVRDGMHVTLWYDPNSISVDLRDMADASRLLDVLTKHAYLDRSFREAMPMPTQTRTSSLDFLPSGPSEYGYRDGLVYALLSNNHGQRTISQIERNEDGIYEKLVTNDHRCSDDLLKRVWQQYHGALEWKADRTE